MGSAILAVDYRSIEILDPGLNVTVERKYAVIEPQNLTGPLGLILYFHGWTMNYRSTQMVGYNDNVDKYNYIMVYPNGMSDLQPGYNSWNFGGLDNDTCVHNETMSICYDSCRNSCTQCSWTTCYDDVFFVNELIKTLKSQYNINDAEISILGASNGGMFAYHLAGKVNAKNFIPIYGNLPSKGLDYSNSKYLPAPEIGQNLLSYYDIEDTIVPMNGGKSSDGYWYNSKANMINKWAIGQGCKYWEPEGGVYPFEVETPYTGGLAGMKCWEYHCNKSKIMDCEYHGWHGMVTENEAELHLWFIYDYEKPGYSSSSIIRTALTLLLINFLK